VGLSVGTRLGPYEIVAPLGAGGMGEVYRARDTRLQRDVAIKILSSDLSANADLKARFEREAHVISAISHPHICHLYDIGNQDGVDYLVMELVEGETLADRLKQGTLPIEEALRIAIELADALRQAHAKGIVHRDLKPGNVMLTATGAKLLDFGLAKPAAFGAAAAAEGAPSPVTLSLARPAGSPLTSAGMIVGTPQYLSPEQAAGKAVDGRSDLFSLGALLYECIAGRPAFSGSSVIEIGAQVLHVDPPALSTIRLGTPAELDRIAAKALEKKPEQRYQSAEEMRNDLRTALTSLGDTQPLPVLSTPPQADFRALSATRLANVTQTLRRPRVSLGTLIIVAGLLGCTIAGLLYWRRSAVHKPPAAAVDWYNRGADALRNGAYYGASKALEQAIAIDDKYALAHARLAEALLELDYVDRAKDELLRATSLASGRSQLPTMDALYVEAISATVRHDFRAAIQSSAEIAKQSADSEKASALVDLGRAYEKNDDTQKAIASYAEAAARNGQYPTAFLRLGILYGRQQELANAITAFDKAEALYQALGNLEGRAEVAFQRGALFNKLNKMADGKAQLDQALNLARAADNKSQVIKTLLQLSSVAADVGETAHATEYASEAVDVAQKNGMENLSARGLVDLGNGFLIRGEHAEAEKYLSQAIQSAQRVRARSSEARARVSMANLRQQQNNPDEAVRYLEPALAFYQQGSYRSETFSCLVLLARANLQKGEYEAAIKADQQLLQMAQQGKDQSQIALAHAEIGSALARVEKYPEALDQFNEAYVINKAQGVERSIGFNLLSRGNVLWQLGRYQEARFLLDEGTAIAEKAGGYQRMAAEIKLVDAEISLSQAHFSQAKAKAERLLALTGTRFPALAIGARRVLGLAQARGGAGASGRQTCAQAVEMASRLNDPWQLAKARLALAEAMLLAGDAQAALTDALQARESFTRLGEEESEWRAWLIAGRASQRLGDTVTAREQMGHAKQVLSQLREQWGDDNFTRYLARPDIRAYYKQIS
jgi:serine/threonine protein kinase/Tfp pilus assembly protein PilF